MVDDVGEVVSEVLGSAKEVAGFVGDVFNGSAFGPSRDKSFDNSTPGAQAARRDAARQMYAVWLYDQYRIEDGNVLEKNGSVSVTGEGVLTFEESVYEFLRTLDLDVGPVSGPFPIVNKQTYGSVRVRAVTDYYAAP